MEKGSAVAKRSGLLSNRWVEKTIAIVFQIRLQLVRAKSHVHHPTRTVIKLRQKGDSPYWDDCGQSSHIRQTKQIGTTVT